MFWIESILLVFLGLLAEFLTSHLKHDSTTVTHAAILQFAPIIVLQWFFIASTVKRWHDLDHSGWFILLNFAVIPFPFTFVYTYFFKGTKGPNRFGADPV